MVHTRTSPLPPGSIDPRSNHSLPTTSRLDIVNSKTLLRTLSEPLPLPLAKVAGALSGRRGAIITRDEFVAEIWGELASGGPLSAELMICQYVALLRSRGLQIATFRARGYGIGLA